MAKMKRNIPECVGIIMDGNRRWAKARGLSGARGHEAGYETLKQMVRWAKEAHVQHMIAYAFSTENWKRSEIEVTFLMRLFERMLTEMADEAAREGTRLSFIGERDRFSKKIQKQMETVELETKNHRAMHLVIALSYGARAELVAAFKQLAGKKGLTEDDITQALWTADAEVPDPDLIIRTGGELRLSNFLLWQAAYSELFFTNTLWPDFSQKEFRAIIAAYGERERRRGA